MPNRLNICDKKPNQVMRDQVIRADQDAQTIAKRGVYYPALCINHDMLPVFVSLGHACCYRCCTDSPLWAYHT